MTDGARLALVVLAGGTSRRWAGVDKTARRLAGRPVLLHCLDALTVLRERDPHAEAVVVAPTDHPDRALVDAEHIALQWVREEPPGAGPAAGLAAGLARVARAEVVAVLAGDLPFAAGAVPRLLEALRDNGCVDAALGTDAGGRWQPLLAVYRRAALQEALGGDVENASLRPALRRLRTVEVPVDAVEALDLDTPADLERAETVLREGTALSPRPDR